MGRIAQQRTFVLRQARLRLGLAGVKKTLVWTAAARLMGSPIPKTNEDGYALLAVFLKTNYVAAIGQFAVQAPPKKRRVTGRSLDFAVTDAFLATFEWRQLRMIVLKKRGPRCECCGAKAPDVQIHVDHVKPRRHYPELALEESNLQILCEVCNHGKGSWDETDWRTPSTTQGEARGLPIPGTATATSTISSYMPRLVRRR